MKNNKGVKFLNLFNNKIAFDGAKAFAECLAVNKVLEFIEFGHNRIRNKGLSELAKGIARNDSTNL